ncbi:MAG TPA: GT4 family glycosyltransferase PelF [Acidobacteriota bacterium]|nr:GT4 family glycosyltransferase PelF [Acidobacteriota bacterium]HND19065.1 GT4 family glycosyltransferase PelF [Acidobacteriota bacterium]
MVHTVLLATEGTYPFHGGGVSTWCNVLLHRLEEFQYRVLSVIMHPYLPPRYDPPPNLKSIIKVPLWGTEDPAEQQFDRTFATILNRRRQTTEPMIRRHFLPIFEALLDDITGNATGAVTGKRFADMAAYFRQFDYFETFRSRVIWYSFQDFLRAWVRSATPALPSPTVRDAAECLQLLTRLLLVLDVEVPRTSLTHSAAAAVCGLPCVVAKLRHGTPYLLTEHGVYLREQYLNVARTARSTIVKRFLLGFFGAVVRANYHYADVVSPVCQYNARWELAQGVAPDRLQVIYNGSNETRFCPLDLPRRHRPTVTQVGLIFALKGTKDLIQAAAQVRAAVPEVEFLLYGSASDPAYFAECQTLTTQLGLEQTVTFAGLTSHPEQVFNQADVVTLSSISEGFPYTIVEAMLCGSAIVATNVGGVGEALADTGLLVPPRTPDQLAQAIVKLLTNAHLRRDLGQRARERALTHFTESQFATHYRDLYQQLIGG